LLRSIAAGSKAQSVCFGRWNAGKSLEQIGADALSGFGAANDRVLSELKAEVDATQRVVRPAYQEAVAPRFAWWNALTGCTAMPIGWQAKFPKAAAGTRLKPGAWDTQA
jgi:hypothetical protein